jgi:hypothetical protein
MKQKKEEIQFEPVNKLTKNIYGTKVAINLDEEKLQSVKEIEYVIENLEARSHSSGGNGEMKEEGEDMHNSR